jgi:heme exporter protein A
MSELDKTRGTFAGRELACVRGERLLFRGLSFVLPPGGALVLSGPNGSGKSSLLRLMAGLLPPASGALTWDGRPVGDAPEAQRARLAYLGHLDALKPTLTVGETLALHAGLRGRRADVAAALDALALGALGDTPCRQLSAGQRRRVALARLVVAPAPLWLLDEPTVGLDDAGLAAFRAIAVAHRRVGGALVAATHSALGLTDAPVLMPAAFAPSRTELEAVA